MTEEAGSVLSAEDVLDWVNAHGDILFRYALARVGKRDVAEDLVQDAFLAALSSSKEFEGRSKVQTWLIGILRHKILDHLRKASRRRESDARIREAESSSGSEFFHNGHWRTPVKNWSPPSSGSLEAAEFWQVLDDCQEKLPHKLESAFRMRDVEELSSDEICELLEISPGNLNVRLHRARLLLRDCLERRWFS